MYTAGMQRWSSSAGEPRLVVMLSESWTMIDPRNLRAVVDLASVVERAGAHGVLVGEHVVMGPGADRNGIPDNPRDFFRNGNQDPTMAHPSSLEVLSAMAAVTEGLRLHAVALLTPLRHPLTVGKQLATLDLISQGRLVFMPTTSWQEEEYDALGVSFEARGGMLDEQMEIWSHAWRDEVISHHAENYSFDDIYFSPKPWLPRGPRLWVGGSRLHARALRRIVRYADGFFPSSVPTDDELDRLSAALTSAGRSTDDIELTMWLGATTAFPTPTSTKPLGPALDAAAPNFARGVTTFVMKASQYIDDVTDLGDLIREAQRGLEERVQ
jgi:alkanesulfonate monooxygenase SsuD/methylene tetrahydromethanopterin reductase-like flavin-dependent oxidoreductase (luciferase family)